MEDFIGKYVIVRTFSAGVHAGTLRSMEGTQVVLATARRIWRWSGANTLNEIALHGASQGSRLSECVPTILLTEAIEVIPCLPEAVEVLNRLGWGSDA